MSISSLWTRDCEEERSWPWRPGVPTWPQSLAWDPEGDGEGLSDMPGRGHAGAGGGPWWARGKLLSRLASWYLGTCLEPTWGVSGVVGRGGGSELFPVTLGTPLGGEEKVGLDRGPGRGLPSSSHLQKSSVEGRKVASEI